MTLCLHSGAKTTTVQQLVNLPKPTPMSPTHQPVRHDRLVRETKLALWDAGYEVTEEQHGVTPDNQRYFGTLKLKRIGESLDKDFQLMAGLRNANDYSFLASLCIGATVFVCDNLSFCSEIVVGRRHTKNILRDLSTKIYEAAAQVRHVEGVQNSRFAHYKDTPAPWEQTHNLVIEALDAKAIKATDIPQILQEYREPTHETFREHGYSTWRLFNAFTENMKRVTNPHTFIKRSQLVHEILDNHAQFN